MRGESGEGHSLFPTLWVMEWWQDVASLYSSLNWYRSWPSVIPEGRAYVHDHLPRLEMSNCDYNTIEFPDDKPGFCLLEWDVALDIQGRTLFGSLAEERPDRPLVAPYIKSYGTAVMQVHRRLGFIPIEEGAETADFVGFGCIYLPQQVLKQYLDSVTGREQFTDVSFSYWYAAVYGQIDVTWQVRPQHLHGD